MTHLRIAAFGTAVGSAVALMSLPADQARAQIAMSVEVGAGPVEDLATFGGVGSANGYVMSSAAIVALNTFLGGAGSQYEFTLIGGTSNFPGTSDPDVGQLTLDGTLMSVGTGPTLTITETESGFTAPPPYYLFSSSTGLFTNQPAGGGHTASSSFNGASTPTYSVLSDGILPNTQVNMVDMDILGNTPYTVSNTIIFDLAPGTTASPITDEFSVIGTVIPEPSTWAMMLLGFAGLGFFGYRQTRKAKLQAA